MRIAAQFTYEYKMHEKIPLKLTTVTFMQSIPKGTYEIHEHNLENHNGEKITKTVVLKSIP
jgi:hypothetical protein